MENILDARDKHELAMAIAQRVSINTKEVLTSDECALYLGISKSALYKYTCDKKIPHYKSPTGKLCYFNRKEIEEWCQGEKVKMEL